MASLPSVPASALCVRVGAAPNGHNVAGAVRIQREWRRMGGSGGDRSTSRLLWAACRPVLRPEAVAATIEDGAEVPRAARVAMSQQAAPLMWRALSECGHLDLLGDTADQLRREYELRRAQAALLVPLALRTAMEPLRSAGLEPVVLKGPALAARYPQPGLRPMQDVDLLLAPRDHAAGVAALTDGGWIPWGGDARHEYDTVLCHPSLPHLPLELHHGLESWRDRAHALTAHDLWAKRRPLDCMGVATFGLPVEDELVMLATHAAKPFHHFQRIIWSVDFAVVIAAAGATIDWDAVAARARASRCETAVAVALRHARRLGASVPDEAARVPVRRWRREALAPLLDETWPLAAGNEQLAHRLRYALPDAGRDRARLTVGEVAAAGALHAPARAGRLVTKVVRRVRRRSREAGA